MNIQVKYGIDVVDKEVEGETTIGDIVSDENLKCALGFGDNVRALINGVEQPNHAIVPPGATVKIETRANSKAVLPNPVLV